MMGAPPPSSNGLARLAIDEAKLIERFDELIKKRVIFYDPDPKVLTVEHGGCKFEFRITGALKNKPGVSAAPDGVIPPGPSGANPIPGSDINVSGAEVQLIGTTHIIAYNMFSAFRPHLLLLTQDGYRKQYEPLDIEAISASHAILSALKGEYLVFYNCGVASGCSRFHKHLQVVPSESETFGIWRDVISDRTKMPYRAFTRSFGPEFPSPQEILSIYLELFEQAQKALGQSLGDDNKAPPHNVLFDRRGIMVIPRRAAGRDGAEANAMGMLGVVWMSNESIMKKWTDVGASDVLKAAGVP